MKYRAIFYWIFVLPALLIAVPPATPAGVATVKASYLYTLSNFTGKIPVTWAKISIDETAREVYALWGSTVRVFNENGMEVYSFNEDGRVGYIRDVAIDEEGTIFALIARENNRFAVLRCNYRGEVVSALDLKNIPSEFSDFNPGRLRYRNGVLYLASFPDMRVLALNRDGVISQGYDVLSLMNFEEKDKQDAGFTGFNIDNEGNILFTISAIGKAYRLLPDKTIQEFGKRGSNRGKFGVPADIATDQSGKFIAVADILRCVVIVFDNRFNCLAEFGFRGNKPGNLIGPMYLAIDGRNRIYVSQLANRGINVYQIGSSDSS